MESVLQIINSRWSRRGWQYFNMFAARSQFLLESTRAPQEEDRWIDEQFHQSRSDNSTDHRSCDAFHYVGAGAVAPQDWKKTGDDDGGGHGFRADAFDGPVVDGVAQIGDVAHFPVLDPLLVGKVEVQEHDEFRHRGRRGR